MNGSFSASLLCLPQNAFPSPAPIERGPLYCIVSGAILQKEFLKERALSYRNASLEMVKVKQGSHFLPAALRQKQDWRAMAPLARFSLPGAGELFHDVLPLVRVLYILSWLLR